jgi:hypothetical protein
MRTAIVAAANLYSNQAALSQIANARKDMIISSFKEPKEYRMKHSKQLFRRVNASAFHAGQQSCCLLR